VGSGGGGNGASSFGLVGVLGLGLLSFGGGTGITTCSTAVGGGGAEMGGMLDKTGKHTTSGLGIYALAKFPISNLK